MDVTFNREELTNMSFKMCMPNEKNKTDVTARKKLFVLSVKERIQVICEEKKRK